MHIRWRFLLFHYIDSFYLPICLVASCITYQLKMANLEEQIKHVPLTNITICGGGNGAHVSAGYLAAKPGYSVNVLTRQPGSWTKEIVVQTHESSWEHKGTIVGHLNCVTADASAVIPQSDIVIIAAPANAHSDILKKIVPFLNSNTLLGTLYAQGGFDWAASNALSGDFSKIKALFGFQNIPWLCRIIEYGKAVWIMGPKKILWVTCIPLDKANDVSAQMSQLFDIPTEIVPNFLSLTLTPSNQIIHPARYYGIFRNWDGSTPLKKEEIQWGLYTEMDDFSANWMAKLDLELQAIKKYLVAKFPSLDLSFVIPLEDRVKLQYCDDIGDKSNLKTIFATNKAYRGCITPTMAVADGFYPALKSRLFWEDIPCGLCLLKNIAEMMNLSTPAIDFMIEWHQQFMGIKFVEKGFLLPEAIALTTAPISYNIFTLEDLVAPSLPGGTKTAVMKASPTLAMKPENETKIGIDVAKGEIDASAPYSTFAQPSTLFSN